MLDCLGDIVVFNALVRILHNRKNNVRILFVTFQAVFFKFPANSLEELLVSKDVVTGEIIIVGLECTPVDILVNPDSVSIRQSVVLCPAPRACARMETSGSHPRGKIIPQDHFILSLPGMFQSKNVLEGRLDCGIKPVRIPTLCISSVNGNDA